MKKINSSNVKYLEKAQELSDSRNKLFSEELQHQIHNYEISQIEPITLIHFILKQKPEKEILNFAIKNYIINLISLWETFFRDLFVITMKLDSNFKNYIVKNYLKLNQNCNNDPDEEILALSSNFQNLNDLNETFKFLFNNEDILNVIGKNKQDIFMPPYIIEKFSINQSFENWQDKIKKSFNLRHKFIHDANFKYDFNIKDIKEIEILFNLVPKIFINMIADKYKLQKFVAYIEDKQVKYIHYADNGFRYISTINDILSSDFGIVDESPNKSLEEERVIPASI